MNRIDRLFAITTQLQSRRSVRATDLAGHFEVSPRTIYRDIAALSESGIPIIALPGQGFALADGFFLPPLHLTTDEATALILGARLLSSSATRNVAAAADEAVDKLLSVLGNDQRRLLADISDVFELSVSPGLAGRLDLTDERIAALQRAILERRVISPRYFRRNRAQETHRQVEPRRLTFVAGAWYLSAFCRLRQDDRAFRLDRIDGLAVEPERFRPRAADRPRGSPASEAVVRFWHDVARWAEERQHWSFVAATRDDGNLIATYRLNDLDQIAPWLLGWGTAVEVISPRALRERLRHEAERVAEMLT